MLEAYSVTVAVDARAADAPGVFLVSGVNHAGDTMATATDAGAGVRREAGRHIDRSALT